MRSSTRKPKFARLEPFRIFDFRKRKTNTTPIDDSSLSIREMKSADKPSLLNIINETKRDYYTYVYRSVFRSWFTYVSIACLLGLSLSYFQNSTISVCCPPFLITMLLLWKVNRYKRVNRTYNVYDLENINHNETGAFKYKSTELRRANQGVYLVFYKKEKTLENLELDSDLDITSSDSESENKKTPKNDDKNKILVGYLVYQKQRDEFETVCIKEFCIHKDYRQRCIGKNFLRRMCLNVFRTFNYRRVTYTASSFHSDLMKISKKKNRFD